MVTVTQNYVRNSPVVQALNDVFDHDVLFDLRTSIRFDTCPIEVVRMFVDSIGLGVHTTMFGEAFERAVANNAWFLFNSRNRQSGVDKYAELLRIFYDETFTLTGTLPYQEKSSLAICITAVLGTGLPDADIQVEVERAITWLLPHYTGNLTVFFCSIEDASVVYNTGFHSYVEYNFER